jgi:hypothetical protein
MGPIDFAMGPIDFAMGLIDFAIGSATALTRFRRYR